MLENLLDGPLQLYDDDYDDYKKKYKRNSGEMVALKYLSNSQNITNEFLDEVKAYYNADSKILIYGISQNPDTKDYIMVLQYRHCEECGEEYANTNIKWCKPCLINNLPRNEKMNDFIKEVQSKIDKRNDAVFEWVPYNQFSSIKKMSKGNSFAIVYSAIWKDGPLHLYKKNYKINSYEKVALKYLSNSQNITNEFLDEVKAYYNADSKILIYGISQNPDTKGYMMVLQYRHCEKCGKEYANANAEWCKQCLINNLPRNENIDDFIQGVQLKIDKLNDAVFGWIPYNQFNNIEKINKGGFSTIYSAIWKNRLVSDPNKKVVLKCLDNSQNFTDEFINEVKQYSDCHNNNSKILKVYGISQHPDTEYYIIVLQYACGGNFNNWTNKNYKYFSWLIKLEKLFYIAQGLKEIHQKQMVHRDLHTGNILFTLKAFDDTYISDMGLSGEVGNIDESKIYGVMPYVAPEVLRGKPYTQTADIYSFGMIMYFAATGKQPFSNCAHDQYLALKICNGIRPEINEPDAPKCYIDLMKKCWDSNPDNRPNVIEIEKLIGLFRDSYNLGPYHKQFIEAEEYRKANLSSIEYSQLNTHPQAIYTSRLLNPYTKDLPKYDDNIAEITNDLTKCIDFTKLSENEK